MQVCSGGSEYCRCPLVAVMYTSWAWPLMRREGLELAPIGATLIGLRQSQGIWESLPLPSRQQVWSGKLRGLASWQWCAGKHLKVEPSVRGMHLVLRIVPNLLGFERAGDVLCTCLFLEYF